MSSELVGAIRTLIGQEEMSRIEGEMRRNLYHAAASETVAKAKAAAQNIRDAFPKTQRRRAEYDKAFSKATGLA